MVRNETTGKQKEQMVLPLKSRMEGRWSEATEIVDNAQLPTLKTSSDDGSSLALKSPLA
tara:strand:+ start:740 stop:916 length:177 start_codon:yes stop_codon:yes gene_type:complete